MGYGPTKNGVQHVITPRDGKAWCDTVNTTPMPVRHRSVLALGTCRADGSGFVPYDKPVERQVGF